jgi:hypothetical protein
MKVCFWFALLAMITMPAFAGSPGSFAGTVVRGPDVSDSWLYIEGRNHSVRRVEVSGAKFEYDDDVPVRERKSPVPKALPPGTSVRITAEQDDAGEWRATAVEILKPSSEEKKSAATTTSQS